MESRLHDQSAPVAGGEPRAPIHGLSATLTLLADVLKCSPNPLRRRRSLTHEGLARFCGVVPSQPQYSRICS